MLVSWRDTSVLGRNDLFWKSLTGLCEKKKWKKNEPTCWFYLTSASFMNGPGLTRTAGLPSPPKQRLLTYSSFVTLRRPRNGDKSPFFTSAGKQHSDVNNHFNGDDIKRNAVQQNIAIPVSCNHERAIIGAIVHLFIHIHTSRRK